MPNDATEPLLAVTKARELLVTAVGAAQSMLDAGWLPVKKTKVGKAALAEGAHVRIREKFLPEYAGLFTETDLAALEVAMVKGGKVFVRVGPAGSKKALGFTPRKHLEAAV